MKNLAWRVVKALCAIIRNEEIIALLWRAKAKLLRAAAPALPLIAASSSAHAHPGHDLFDHGASHVVSSWYHLLVLTLGGIVFALAARFISHRRARWRSYAAAST